VCADEFVCGLRWLQCGWYWGAMGFDEAEARLADKPDGTFLVRDSSDDRYILSLSFRSLGSTHHTRIEHYKGYIIILHRFISPQKVIAKKTPEKNRTYCIHCLGL